MSPLLGVVGLHAGPRPHAQLAPGAGRVDAGQPGVVADVQGPDKRTYVIQYYIILPPSLSTFVITHNTSQVAVNLFSYTTAIRV